MLLHATFQVRPGGPRRQRAGALALFALSTVALVLMTAARSEATPPPANKAVQKPVPATAVTEKPATARVIRPLDVLVLFCPGSGLPDQPVNGPHLVEPDGDLFLGPLYGRVKVAGKTREEADVAVHHLLRQFLRTARVFLQDAGRAKWRSGRAPAVPYRVGPGDLLQIHAIGLPGEPIDGQFRVAADGSVLLGKSYGKVTLKDLTLEEAGEAVNKSLRKFFEEPWGVVSLAGWEPEQKVIPLPQVADLLEAYVRAEEPIELRVYSLLGDAEIVKRIGLTDTQRQGLLRMVAEDDLKWFAANPPYDPLTGEKRAYEDSEQLRKEARKRVEAVLTPRQLQDLKDLSFAELARECLLDVEMLKLVLQDWYDRIAEVNLRRDALDEAAKQRVETVREKAVQRFLALLSEAQRATLRETLWQQAHRKCDRADVIASLDDLKSYVAYLQTFNENWGGVARYLADADARNQLGFSSEQERRRQTIVAACKAVLDESVAEMQKLSPPEQASRGNDFKTKIDRAYRDVQAQIEGLLTPQQAPAFKEIVMRMHVRSLPDDGETFNVITAATQQKAAARQIWEQQESESRRIFAETRAQRLSLLTAAELQRLREAIDRNDWTELVPRFGPSYR